MEILKVYYNAVLQSEWKVLQYRGLSFYSILFYKVIGLLPVIVWPAEPACMLSVGPVFNLIGNYVSEWQIKKSALTAMIAFAFNFTGNRLHFPLLHGVSITFN